MCSLEAVVAKDGKEYIIEVNDSAMGLMGESQEEDRRNIAEFVIKEMEVFLKRIIQYFSYFPQFLVEMQAARSSSTKSSCPVSEAGSRPGSSLSVAESAKGRKATVETGSLRKDPEKVKETSGG